MCTRNAHKWSFVHFVFCAVLKKRPVVPSAGKGRPPRSDAPLDPQPQPQA